MRRGGEGKNVILQNKTNTSSSSFRAARWGLEKGLRGLRSALLPYSLILNFKYVEEGQGNYLMKEGKVIPCVCELKKT